MMPSNVAGRCSLFQTKKVSGRYCEMVAPIPSANRCASVRELLLYPYERYSLTWHQHDNERRGNDLVQTPTARKSP